MNDTDRTIPKSPNFRLDETDRNGWSIRSRKQFEKEFFDNYRRVTRSLGKDAIKEQQMLNEPFAYKKGQELDSQTKNIMQRIKLPTFVEAMSDNMKSQLMQDFKNDPQKTEQAVNKMAADWDEDNFYYKLRAAQLLKQMPEDHREGLLNNFNMDKYEAKVELDNAMNKQWTIENNFKSAIVNARNNIQDGLIPSLRQAIGSLIPKKGNN